jgi:hypothetical protein
VARCLSATQKTYNTVGSRLLRRSPRSLGVPLRLRSPKSYHPTHTNAANQATFTQKHWPTNAFTPCERLALAQPKGVSDAENLRPTSCKRQAKAFHGRKKAHNRGEGCGCWGRGRSWGRSRGNSEAGPRMLGPEQGISEAEKALVSARKGISAAEQGISDARQGTKQRQGKRMLGAEQSPIQRRPSRCLSALLSARGALVEHLKSLY